jgi:hypothetical protein
MEPTVRVACTVTVTSVKNTNTYVPRTIFTGAVFTSVGEPDPDPYVFVPPGSGSFPFFIKVLSSRLKTEDNVPGVRKSLKKGVGSGSVSQRCGSGSGSAPKCHRSLILVFTVL